MSVSPRTPLLSSLSLSKQPKPEDCRLVGLYTYLLFTRLNKPNTFRSMLPVSLTVSYQERATLSLLCYVGLVDCSMTSITFKRETFRRVSVHLHFLTLSLPQNLNQPPDIYGSSTFVSRSSLSPDIYSCRLLLSAIVFAWYLQILPFSTVDQLLDANLCQRRPSALDFVVAWYQAVVVVCCNQSSLSLNIYSIHHRLSPSSHRIVPFDQCRCTESRTHGRHLWRHSNRIVFCSLEYGGNAAVGLAEGKSAPYQSSAHRHGRCFMIR